MTAPQSAIEAYRARTETELERLGVQWDHSTGILPTRLFGVYRRASTFGQLAGYRQLTMVDDMTDTVLAKGPEYGVIVFDEGNRSGRSLAGREVAALMIAALERGDIDGIAAPDIKRLSRDEWLGGGREIAEALRRRRGLLILERGIELDLRSRLHYKFYKQELKAASDEIDEIKYTFYSGMAGRAKLILEGKVEPMFRYRAPYGYRHVECRDESGNLVIVRGVVRRTLAKDPALAEPMALLADLFATASSLGAIAAEMNRRGYPTAGPVTRWSKGWTTQKLLTILRDNPVYWGEWRLVRNPQSDVWFNYESDATKVFPELAYWTADQARGWQARLIQPTVQRRHRTYEHHFLGVLVCNACGTVLQGAGHNGYRCADYNTKGYRGECPRPQILEEKSATAALRDVFPTVIREQTARIIERQRQHEQAQQNDPIAAQLRILDQQEQRLIDLALASDVTPAMQAARQRIVEERKQIEARRARQAAVPSHTATQVDRLVALRDAPLEVYDELTPAQQGDIWRLLAIRVVVERQGRGRSAKFTATVADTLSEENIWRLASYFGREAGSSRCA